MRLPGALSPAANVGNVTWYRAAPSSVANPRHVPSARAVNRFNDGTTGYRLLYFAQDPRTALFEVRALLGFVSGPFAPAAPSPRSWTIFQHRIQLGPKDIIDFGQPANRAAIDTTIQELTGDWEGYHMRPLSAQASLPIGRLRAHAPTQELGAWLATHPNAQLSRVPEPVRSEPPDPESGAALRASSRQFGLRDREL